MAKGTSQRRPGLHTESPGFVTVQSEVSISPLYRSHAIWGGGTFGAQGIVGGIYMISSVAFSTKVYHCKITDAGLIGPHGSVEHLRYLLDRCAQSSILAAGEPYWLTGGLNGICICIAIIFYSHLF